MKPRPIWVPARLSQFGKTWSKMRPAARTTALLANAFSPKKYLVCLPPPPPLFVSKYSLNSPKHFWHEEKVKRPKSTNSDYFSIRTLHQKYRLIHKDPRDLKWQTGIWVSLQKPGCLQTQTDFVCKCRHVRACGNFEDWHKIIHL